MVLTQRGPRLAPGVVEACRRGDRDAFRALYDAYKDKVYSIALYFFHRDEQAAADVTQQVFLKLMTGIGQYRGEAQFSTWLYRLVMNVCLDRSRRAKAAPQTMDPVALDRRPAAGSHEDDFERRQMAGRIQAAVSSLSPKMRAAVLLRYFDDLSYAEMAAVLGCSIGTVASRLNRAHDLLAAALAPQRRRLRTVGEER
jgi:RNA polymerase sigma-70 factor (ECF subfamily)